MVHTVTVDELSYRLRRAAWRSKDVHRFSKEMSKRLPDRNDVAGALEYVNKRFCIGIEYLGDVHLREEARCGILFDLANLPLPMVLERLQREGASI